MRNFRKWNCILWSTANGNTSQKFQYLRNENDIDNYGIKNEEKSKSKKNDGIKVINEWILSPRSAFER